MVIDMHCLLQKLLCIIETAVHLIICVQKLVLITHVSIIAF